MNARTRTRTTRTRTHTHASAPFTRGNKRVEHKKVHYVCSSISESNKRGKLLDILAFISCQYCRFIDNLVITSVLVNRCVCVSSWFTLF